MIGSPGDECTADDVGVAADVLGGRVEGHVGAEGERLLQVRGGKGVVDNREDLLFCSRNRNRELITHGTAICEQCNVLEMR